MERSNYFVERSDYYVERSDLERSDRVTNSILVTIIKSF